MKILFVCVFIVYMVAEAADQDPSIPAEERIKFLKFQINEQLQEQKEKLRQKKRYKMLFDLARQKSENQGVGSDEDAESSENPSGRKELERRSEQQEEKAYKYSKEANRKDYGGGAKLVFDEYDYVDLKNVPITPIMANDHRKKDQYHLRELKTTAKPTIKTSFWTPNWSLKEKKVVPAARMPEADGAELEESELKISMKALAEKPVDTFYYRRQVDTSFFQTPLQWLHCDDLISPLLKGLRTECSASEIKLVDPSHRILVRLYHLIELNMTHYAKDEVYSLLYQLSNIQIRMFQWSVPAMRVLFNILSHGEKHTFRTIKWGLKALFRSWHLDFSNVTNLLRQSRLFRPLCISDGTPGGSTKSSRNTRHTRSTETTTKCTDSDSDTETLE